MKASDLPRLAAPFPASDIEWKPGATTRDKSKGLAMAYLTSRAVQQRFDDICGPGDWRNEFQPGPDGGVLCGVSIRVDREDGTSEWVTKWDGADNSQVEAVKGGLSGAMKRAAVQWGVGRYLYELPATWVRLDDRGRFAEPPRIPREHLPAGNAAGNDAPPSVLLGKAALGGHPSRRRTPHAAERAAPDRPVGRRAPHGRRRDPPRPARVLGRRGAGATATGGPCVAGP